MGVSALEWRERMTEPPRLVHADGLVMVQLGEDSVLFPTEADARFFHAAYTDVPNLEGLNASLRTQIDEAALHKALNYGYRLEAEVEALKQERASLQDQNAVLAEKAAKAVVRAKILASAVTRAVKGT